jgi:hypothetical protein
MNKEQFEDLRFKINWLFYSSSILFGLVIACLLK